jgi:hypothetical protein
MFFTAVSGLLRYFHSSFNANIHPLLTTHAGLKLVIAFIASPAVKISVMSKNHLLFHLANTVDLFFTSFSIALRFAYCFLMSAYLLSNSDESIVVSIHSLSLLFTKASTTLFQISLGFGFL